ncbi:MAG: uncharacterized protein KVP18_002670 [Porospora cf. gigantea A]|uniref:uncharacterized protein n=1 Tax=Porospora cf. gigantea A TaxID=2853593 RepID=UPI0035595DA8|nr:MAG: hypothetical protein KVP18_002670 [Porospora cf. gigantea A]
MLDVQRFSVSDQHAGTGLAEAPKSALEFANSVSASLLQRDVRESILHDLLTPQDSPEPLQGPGLFDSFLILAPPMESVLCFGPVRDLFPIPSSAQTNRRRSLTPNVLVLYPGMSQVPTSLGSVKWDTMSLQRETTVLEDSIEKFCSTIMSPTEVREHTDEDPEETEETFSYLLISKDSLNGQKVVWNARNDQTSEPITFRENVGLCRSASNEEPLYAVALHSTTTVRLPRSAVVLARLQMMQEACHRLARPLPSWFHLASSRAQVISPNELIRFRVPTSFVLIGHLPFFGLAERILRRVSMNVVATTPPDALNAASLVVQSELLSNARDTHYWSRKPSVRVQLQAAPVELSTDMELQGDLCFFTCQPCVRISGGARSLLHAAIATAPPPPKMSLWLPLGLRHTSVEHPLEALLDRGLAPVNSQAGTHIQQAFYGRVFSTLSPECLGYLQRALLEEKRVAIVSPDSGLRSMLVVALLQLFRPLVWRHAAVPVAPDDIDELLFEAPVPVIFATATLPNQFRQAAKVEVAAPITGRSTLWSVREVRHLHSLLASIGRRLHTSSLIPPSPPRQGRPESVMKLKPTERLTDMVVLLPTQRMLLVPSSWTQPDDQLWLPPVLRRYSDDASLILEHVHHAIQSADELVTISRCWIELLDAFLSMTQSLSEDADIRKPKGVTIKSVFGKKTTFNKRPLEDLQDWTPFVVEAKNALGEAVKFLEDSTELLTETSHITAGVLLERASRAVRQGFVQSTGDVSALLCDHHEPLLLPCCPLSDGVVVFSDVIHTGLVDFFNLLCVRVTEALSKPASIFLVSPKNASVYCEDDSDSNDRLLSVPYTTPPSSSPKSDGSKSTWGSGWGSVWSKRRTSEPLR